VVSFWPALGSRYVSHLIRLSRRQTTGYAKQSFSLITSPNCSRGHFSSKESTALRKLILSRNPLPRGHSLFWELRHSKISYFPSRTRRPQQPTSLISAQIYRVRYVARSSHVSNIITTHTSAQSLTEDRANHSRNQGHNLSHYERFQCGDHAVIEICMTHTANEDSPSIHTLGIDEKKGRPRPPTLPHKDQPPEKRRDQTIKILRILLLTPLSHYNLNYHRVITLQNSL